MTRFEKEKNAMYDIREFVEACGARLIILSIPIVDDMPLDSLNKYEKLFIGVRQHPAEIDIPNSTVYINMLTGQELLQLAKQCNMVETLGLVPEYLKQNTPLELDKINYFDDVDIWRAADVNISLHYVKNGERRTPPGKSGPDIWCFGDCVLYGYGLPDEHTLSWYLQTMIDKGNVHAFGTAFDIENLHNLILVSPIKAGDIVIVQTHPIFINLFEMNSYAWTIFDCIPTLLSVEAKFIDNSHLTKFSFQAIAKELTKIIDDIQIQLKFTLNDRDTQKSKMLANEISKVIGNIDQDDTLGVLLVSCNPFTLGYEYLCTMASSMFDHVLVIIVNYGLRNMLFDETINYQIIKSCISKLNNVYAISAKDYLDFNLHWPAYNIRDNIEIGADVRTLTYIYCNALKQFNNVWFLYGETIDDFISTQQFEIAKNIGKHLGFKFCKIPRKKISKIYTRASQIRKEILNNDPAAFECLPEIVVEYFKKYPKNKSISNNTKENIIKVKLLQHNVLRNQWINSKINSQKFIDNFVLQYNEDVI